MGWNGWGGIEVCGKRLDEEGAWLGLDVVMMRYNVSGRMVELGCLARLCRRVVGPIGGFHWATWDCAALKKGC
jgi:hypothetical protein